MKRLLLIAVAILALATPARAEMTNGHSLLRDCHGFVYGIDRPGMKYSFCIGYIMGVLDRAGGPLSPDAICMPSNVPGGIVMEIFARYLTSHPELRDRPGPTLIGMSLANAYPCKVKAQ